MERKKTRRSPERIIKLYQRLWRRVAGGECPPILRLNTLTARALLLLIPEMLPIHKALNSKAYRQAVLELIASN